MGVLESIGRQFDSTPGGGFFDVAPGWQDRVVDDVLGGDLAGDAHTGTPPLMGPGSVAGSVPLAARLAAAIGFEAGRSDTGRTVSQDLLDDVAGVGNGPDSSATPWVKTAVVAGVVLVVVYTVGQLFTINVGDSDA